MGWITLTLRKQTLRTHINAYELQDLSISRQRRMLSRRKNTELSILTNDKNAQIEQAKKDSGYTDAKKAYNDLLKNVDDLDTTSTDYKNALSEASNAYTAAKAEYDEQNEYICTYIDSEEEELENEATEKEDQYDQEQTEIEAQIEAMRSELEEVSNQISEDISSSAVNFGN